jgi:hypothetical protein
MPHIDTIVPHSDSTPHTDTKKPHGDTPGVHNDVKSHTDAPKFHEDVTVGPPHIDSPGHSDKTPP